MSSITITFEDFLLELNFDYLYYGTGIDADVSKAEGCITGYELPVPLTLTSGVVWLRFQSDKNAPYRGFLLNWVANKDVGMLKTHGRYLFTGFENTN